MSSFTKRIKDSIKILMGKQVGPPIQRHIYKLNTEESKIFLDKHVIVTGGTGAIGSAICFDLAAKGATVGVCGRSVEKIGSTINAMTSENPDLKERLIPLVMDVTEDSSISKAFQEWANKGYSLDAFVNNAGGQPGRVGTGAELLWEKEISQVDLVVKTNLRGLMVCSIEAAKIMTEQRYGTIINIGSVHGVGGMKGMTDYATAKAGVIGFTRSFALELGKYGVRCNCVSPGLVNQTAFDGGSPELKSSRNVLGRNGYTQEVAQVVSYLISDSYITGQNIIVDGGRSLGLYGDS